MINLSNIKIEKGIPIPKLIGPSNYPCLEVGDSFELELNGNAVSNLRSSLSQHGKKTNQKFCVRKTDKGARVWRVA